MKQPRFMFFDRATMETPIDTDSTDEIMALLVFYAEREERRRKARARRRALSLAKR